MLEDLNGISSNHILDLLTKVKLTDIINLPAPTQGTPQAPAAKSASASPSRGTPGGLSPLGNGHAVHPGAPAAREAWDDALLPGADDDDEDGGGGGGGAGAAAAAGGVPRGAPFQPTALQSTLDTSPELGHTMRHAGSVTSAEESDGFQDAMEELVSDGSFFMCAPGSSDAQQRMWSRPRCCVGGADGGAAAAGLSPTGRGRVCVRAGCSCMCGTRAEFTGAPRLQGWGLAVVAEGALAALRDGAVHGCGRQAHAAAGGPPRL